MTVPSFQQPSVSNRHPLRPTHRHIGYWLTGLAVGLFLCSGMGLWLGRYYFFELFSHFTIQYVWSAYVLLALTGLYWLIYRTQTNSKSLVSGLIVLLTVVALNRTSWQAGDYDTGELPPSGDVRIFHANVLYTRDEYETTLALLRNQKPNLYVLQEMTPQSIRLVTSRLRMEYPYWFACWSKGPCWTLVGSRTPIQVDRPTVRKWRIIALTTRVNDQEISLITVHPRTPLLPSWFRERNAQLAYAAKATRQSPVPTVLIGDFNISVFSPIYEDLFEDTESGNGTQSTNKTGNLTAARHRLTQPTWPRFFPPMMIPIDHAFANGSFTPVSFQTLAHTGSDHRAVVVDLAFGR